jgi:hypothetical protein
LGGGGASSLILKFGVVTSARQRIVARSDAGALPLVNFGLLPLM